MDENIGNRHVWFVDNDVSLELLPNANYAIIFNAILLWGKED
jgi:hypothetical protein